MKEIIVPRQCQKDVTRVISKNITMEKLNRIKIFKTFRNEVRNILRGVVKIECGRIVRK